MRLPPVARTTTARARQLTPQAVNGELIDIRRARTTTLMTGLVLLGATAPAAPAQVEAGGVAPAEPPIAEGVGCRSGCAGLDRVVPGNVVRITGEALERTAAVVFVGAEGPGDDRVAPAAASTAGAVDAVVPAGAASGPVLVVTSDGAASPPTREALTVTTPAEAAGRAGGIEARLEADRVHFAGRRPAQLRVFSHSRAPVTVEAEIVRAGNGRTLMRFRPRTVPGRTVVSLRWSGRVKGKVPSDGRYVFRARVTGGDEGPGRASAARDEAGRILVEERFTFLRHRFPVRGAHTYGADAAAFGAARGGRAHQGQDVFADCGTPLVAARGGRVKFAGRHRRAGNYVVIDAFGTGRDHAYMHLRDPVDLAKGDRVFTGERIGAVGDTGVADGCHLHFEIWGSPGWHTGGSPIDPLPLLRRWDRRG